MTGRRLRKHRKSKSEFFNFRDWNNGQSRNLISHFLDGVSDETNSLGRRARHACSRVCVCVRISHARIRLHHTDSQTRIHITYLRKHVSRPWLCLRVLDIERVCACMMCIYVVCVVCCLSKNLHAVPNINSRTAMTLHCGSKPSKDQRANPMN